MRVIVHLFLCAFFVSKVLGQNIDSLNLVIEHPKNNFEKIKALNVVSELTWLKGNYTESKAYVKQAFELEEKELKNWKKDKTLLLSEKAYSYNNLAIICRFLGNYSQSLENHLIALKIREEIKDTKGIARSNLGLGSIYEFLGNKETALKYKLKAKDLFEQVRDTLFVGFACNHIAGIYFDLGNIQQAERYNGLALMIFIKRSHLTGMADAFTLAGAIFESQKKYEDAISNYNGSLQSSTIFGLKDRSISSNIDLGSVYIKMNKLKEARTYIDSALSLAKKTGAKIHMSNIYYLQYRVDSISNDHKNEIKHYKLYVSFKDSFINQKSSEKIAQLQADFENDKIEKIKVLEEERKELAIRSKDQKQKIILYSITGGLLLMIVLSFVIFRSYRLKQKVNSELTLKNEIISQQKELVEEKQKEISDSINYAKRIQTSFLANKLEFEKHFSEYFILFEPKDVVSGDFYWTCAVDSKLLVGIADSTGHGIPGAFMSLLNISLLNEAVLSRNYTSTVDILNFVRRILILGLKPDDMGQGGNDGMDCAIFSIDFKTLEMEFSGANNPLWMVREGSLIELKPDKMPVGRSPKEFIPFTSQKFQLMKGDIIYGFTDGFADQFGGEKGKKFKYKQLEDIILANHRYLLPVQNATLSETFKAWKGELEQVDDVTILGFKI